MKARAGRTPRRWAEQKWIVDSVIRLLGPEWDQGRVAYTSAPAGTDMALEANSIRANVKKFADITREFKKVARAREERARLAAEVGHGITARDSYFAASLMYGAAMWPIFEDDNRELIELNEMKNQCFDNYIDRAPLHIERVEIPFGGSSLPGLLHLPPGFEEGDKIPFVIEFDGMDGFREMTVSSYGDKILTRGFGVLAVDGPGQGESTVRKVKVTIDNFERAGKASLDYLLARSEVNPDQICIYGVSMGSYWVPRILAYDQRYLAAAVAMVCHEPGMKTIFNSAAPSFKMRYMWMTGVMDEEEFDKFSEKLSLEGLGRRIRTPLLIAAGEDDELSPIEYTYKFYDEVSAPKVLIVYGGERHDISNPYAKEEIADWFRDRADGRPLEPRIEYRTKAPNHWLLEKSEIRMG